MSMDDIRPRVYIRLRPGVTVNIDRDLELQIARDDILWKITEDGNMWILDMPDGVSRGFYSYWDARKYAEDHENG